MREAESEFVIMPLSNKVTVVIEGREEFIALKEASSHDVTLPSAVDRVLTELCAGIPPKSSTSSWVDARQ